TGPFALPARETRHDGSERSVGTRSGGHRETLRRVARDLQRVVGEQIEALHLDARAALLHRPPAARADVEAPRGRMEATGAARRDGVLLDLRPHGLQRG